MILWEDGINHPYFIHWVVYCVLCICRRDLFYFDNFVVHLCVLYRTTCLRLHAWAYDKSDVMLWCSSIRPHVWKYCTVTVRCIYMFQFIFDVMTWYSNNTVLSYIGSTLNLYTQHTQQNVVYSIWPNTIVYPIIIIIIMIANNCCLWNWSVGFIHDKWSISSSTFWCCCVNGSVGHLVYLRLPCPFLVSITFIFLFWFIVAPVTVLVPVVGSSARV